MTLVRCAACRAVDTSSEDEEDECANEDCTPVAGIVLDELPGRGIEMVGTEFPAGVNLEILLSDQGHEHRLLILLTPTYR